MRTSHELWGGPHQGTGTRMEGTRVHSSPAPLDILVSDSSLRPVVWFPRHCCEEQMTGKKCPAPPRAWVVGRRLPLRLTEGWEIQDPGLSKAEGRGPVELTEA